MNSIKGQTFFSTVNLNKNLKSQNGYCGCRKNSLSIEKLYEKVRNYDIVFTSEAAMMSALNDRPEDGKATFVLAIYPSKENLSHLNRYLEMYKSLYDEGVEIGLLHHQCMEPVSIFPNSNVSPRRMEDYLEYLEDGEGMKKRLAQFIRSEME